MWTLLQPGEKHYGSNDAGPLAVVGRLKTGVEPSTAQTELKTILDRVEAPYRDWPKGAGVLVTTLKTDNTRTVRLTLLSLAASVGGLLLIACSNLAALLLGRGSRRRREFAIRAALGCGRAGLVRQLMVESLVIAAAGAVCGVVLAYAAVHGFVALNPLRLTPANPIEVNGRAL